MDFKESIEKLKLVFYIPKFLENDTEVKEIIQILRALKAPSKIKLEHEIKILESQEEQEKLKMDILLNISVRYGIKIKQTQKTKTLLYPQLVVYMNNKPWTFYPQKRAGQLEITINNFLENLKRGKFVGLHRKGVE